MNDEYKYAVWKKPRTSFWIWVGRGLFSVAFAAGLLAILALGLGQ
jgi:hypothetical protein|tara:strand:+ start:195 stop:329 length:135 start_codon:yes stop_codon:yes gene_type:complete